MTITKRTLRYLAIGLGAAAAGVGVFLFLYLAPLAVEVARPEPDVALQVFGLGTVEARVISRVGFEVGNTLAELGADQGDRVTKGAVLARLHNEEQEAQLAKSRARVAQAEATLRQASAQVLKAQAVLHQRQQVNQRRQTLVARGTVSQEAAQDAQADAEVAAAELSLAESQIEVARAALAEATAQERMDTVLLAHHELRAPYDAIVVARQKELGTVLAPGESLFTLVDPATVWVLAHIDESLAGEIRLGQPAEVRLRSLPRRTFHARVARIDVESDRVSEERRVYVACADCPAEFHLGEQAEALITTGRLAAALLVPETAVEGFTGTAGVVWTVEDGRLARRPVSFGHKTLDGRLEIADGLPADAVVVTTLGRGLRVGRAAAVESGAAP